jgi:hypothetical protein
MLYRGTDKMETNRQIALVKSLDVTVVTCYTSVNIHLMHGWNMLSPFYGRRDEDKALQTLK